MGWHKVYLIGKSLFAETLYSLLSEGGNQLAITYYENFQQALQMLDSYPPDVIILVDQDLQDTDFAADIEMSWPDVPIIWAHINDDYLRLVPSQRIRPTQEGLLQAIEALAHFK